MLMRAMLFVTLGLILWCLILLVQECEEDAGHIPKRNANAKKPFRYLQDWSTATWGDWIGLSLVGGVAGYVGTFAHTPLLVAASLIGFCSTYINYIWWMQKRHRPDSGAPKTGVLSYNGAVHLVYFFVYMSLGTYVFLLALVGQLRGTLLFVALLGTIIYLLSLLFDMRRGKFDLLPKSSVK